MMVIALMTNVMMTIIIMTILMTYQREASPWRGRTARQEIRPRCLDIAQAPARHRHDVDHGGHGNGDGASGPCRETLLLLIFFASPGFLRLSRLRRPSRPSDRGSLPCSSLKVKVTVMCMCVSYLAAKVISRFPFSPRSGGTTMMISGTIWNSRSDPHHQHQQEQ